MEFCRDIACRNCIISTSSAVKISLPACRDKYANEYYKYKTKVLPIRWMSPEAIQKDEFSPAADVYSLGILVWELFTKAKSLPFEQMDNEAFLAKVDELDYGLLTDKGPAQIKNLLVSNKVTKYNILLKLSLNFSFLAGSELLNDRLQLKLWTLSALWQWSLQVIRIE